MSHKLHFLTAVKKINLCDTKNRPAWKRNKSGNTELYLKKTKELIVF